MITDMADPAAHPGIGIIVITVFYACVFGILNIKPPVAGHAAVFTFGEPLETLDFCDFCLICPLEFLIVTQMPMGIYDTVESKETIEQDKQKRSCAEDPLVF